MPVQPGSSRWRELVAQGILKDGQRNWFLGDAALEIAPMGTDSAHNGAEANLQQYADEIGVEFHSIRVYRTVAAAWAPDNRVSGTSWKVHQQLLSRPDLIEPGMTVSGAALALGQNNTGRTGPTATVQQRAAAVTDFLDDPDVAEEVGRRLPDMGTRTQHGLAQGLRNFIPPTPDPERQARLDEAEAIAEARETEDEETRESILRPNEFLVELGQLRRTVDGFVTRWSRRDFSLTDTETSVLGTETAAMLRAVSQIAGLRRGHSDMDEALRDLIDAEQGR